MGLIGRVGAALDVLRGTQPASEQPEAEEKLAVGQLGAGFVEFGKQGLQDDKSADVQLIRAYHGWVYANVSAIAEAISQVEPDLQKIKMGKGKFEFEPILSHPVLDLLDKFNDVTTSSEAMYTIAAHLELVGDAFLLKDVPVRPTSFILLDPTKVTIVPKDKGMAVGKYIYKTIVDGKPYEKAYPPELILHIKTPNPENPLRGKSVVAAAGLTIDTNNLASEFLKTFFKNGAIINFALTTDQRISSDEVRRIQTQLKQNYGSVINAFKVLVMGGGFKVESIQQTNKEMGILELEIAMRDKLMAMFKNTKSSLGIVEDVNRANAESSLASWKQNVIKPKMTRIYDAFNEYLIPDYGTDIVLTFSDPVPEDETAKIDQAVKLKNGNIITVNEARTMVGYDPVADQQFNELMDKPDPNAQTGPFGAGGGANKPKNDKKPKNLGNISLERHLRRSGFYKRYEAYRDTYEVARELAEKTIVKRHRHKGEAASRYHDFTEDEAATYWQKQVSRIETIEEQFSNKLDQYLKGIEDKAIAGLHEEIGKAHDKRKSLIDEDQEISAGIDLFAPLLDEIVLLSGIEAYELLHLEAVYSPTRAIHDTVREFTRLMAESVVSTDADKLERILTEGLDQGSSISEIASSIRSQFAQFRQSQAETIARTEVIRASNAGALDAYQQSGVVEMCQWYTAHDDRVEPECAALDGKIVAVGRDFFVSGYGSGAQPPLHPRCRCTLLPVLDNGKDIGNHEARSLARENEALKRYTAELEKLAGIE